MMQAIQQMAKEREKEKEREEKTTIIVTKSTREKLSTLGQKHDTYDDIIRMLIKSYEESSKK